MSSDETGGEQVEFGKSGEGTSLLNHDVWTYDQQLVIWK
jgi:hypothetical protein